MKNLGLYFHIPFCNSKCYYCDFDSKVSTSEDKKVYIENLIKEIDLASTIYNLQEYTIDTIFIGGGTPTSLDEKLLELLLQKIDGSFSFAKNLEYTIEMNPNSISEEKIKIIKNSKINRISIGLQSTNKDELLQLGRTHSYEDFEKTYNLLRKHNFDNINIDVMMGIPHQNYNSYVKNLEKIIALNPEHISAYMLIVEENTRFFDWYNDGIFTLDDELTLKLYEYTINYLKNNGYEQYEISNFAKNDKYCKHNIKYWQVKEYLGFGQSASSYLNKKRFENSNTQYVQLLQKNTLPITNEQIQTKQDLYEEWIFLKLRMNKGIFIDEIDKTFDMNFREKYKVQLQQLYDKKLINDYTNTLSLTIDGIKISNQIFLELM